MQNIKVSNNKTASTRDSQLSDSPSLATKTHVNVFDESLLSEKEYEKLYQTDEEGQAFRESLIADKYFVIVSVGFDKAKFEIFSDLCKKGANIVVLDNPHSSFCDLLLSEGVIKSYIPIDLTSRSTLISECVDAIDDHFMEMNYPAINAITTFWDDAVGLQARLCEVYGVPGNPVHSVDVSHDKNACRMALDLLGFASPKHCTITNQAELQKVTDTLTFPLILKPLYGACSIGVSKVDSPSELHAKYLETIATLEDEYSTGGLMGLVFDDAETVANSTADLMTVIAEEYLDGDEYDCDIVISKGDITYCKVVDNLPLQPPRFCEVMELTPSIKSDKALNGVAEFSKQVTHALGFISGVLHIEVIYDKVRGPCLVECNPRMGGGPMRDIHSYVYGVDLAVEALLCAAGIPALPMVTSVENKYLVTINNHATVSGTLTADASTAIEFVKDDPKCIFSIIENKKGDKTTGWSDGYPTKMGRLHLVFNTSSAYNAVKEANEYLNTFNRNIRAITVLENGSVEPEGPEFYTVWKEHFKFNCR